MPRFFVVEMESNFFPGLALNHNFLNLPLPRTWHYRCVLTTPRKCFIFYFRLRLIGSQRRFVRDKGTDELWEPPDQSWPSGQ
jgi:hypothetical protein